MLLAVRRRGAVDKLVVDVVGALVHSVLHDARGLEQVGLYRGAQDRALPRDVDLSELAEAARVLVECGLRVAEGLEHRVGLDEELADLHRRAGRALRE